MFYPYKKGITTTNQYQFEWAYPEQDQTHQFVRAYPEQEETHQFVRAYPEQEETSEFQRVYPEQEDKSDNNPSPSDPVSSCVINLHVLARDD